MKVPIHLLCLCVLAPIVAGTAARADTVLVNDTFESGATGWFPRFTSGAPALGTAADAILGTGNALTATTTLSGSGPIIGVLGNSYSIPGVAGQSLVLSFDFRFVSGIFNGTTGFAFGLANSNGTPVVAANSASSDDDSTYFAQIATGTAAATSGVYEQTNAGTRLSGAMGTTGFTTVGTDHPVSINDTAAHAVSLSLTCLDATDIQIQLTIDGTVVMTRDDSSVSVSAFDEVFFRSSQTTVGNQYDIDNVTLTATPEPSAPALLGLAALGGGIVLFRRRLSFPLA